ncbi:hypothetical protein Trydic_g19987 [Trypoxylus dichotomus]
MRDDANNEQIINLKREHESQRKSDFAKFEDPSLQALKSGLPEKINQLQSRESLNSCGTVSRKTSTASDYTPEHTYVQDSKPQFLDQTNVIFSTESCMTAVESPPQPKDDKPAAIVSKMENGAFGDHLDLKPGPVDVKILLLSQDTQHRDDASKEIKVDLNEVKETSIIAANVDKLKEVVQNQGGGEDVKPKGLPQRKISRFLVTPVLSALEMPKDKDYGQSAVDSPVVEMGKVDLAKAEQPEIEQAKIELPASKIEIARRDSIPLEIKPVTEVERGQEVILEVGPKETTESMIGPEMITLEQLKKSLDDLKYSGGVRESLSTESKTQKASQAATPVPQVHPIQTPQNQVSSISMSISQTQASTPLVSTAIPPSSYPTNIPPSSVPQNITYSPQISQTQPSQQPVLAQQVQMPLSQVSQPIAQTQIPPVQTQLSTGQSQISSVQPVQPGPISNAQAQMPPTQTQISAGQTQISAGPPQIPTPQPQIPTGQTQIPPVQPQIPAPQPQLPTISSVPPLVPQTDVQINTSIPQSTSLSQVCPTIPPVTSIPQPVQQLPSSMGGVSPLVSLQPGLISPPQASSALPTPQNVVQTVTAPQAVLPNVAAAQAVLPPAVVPQPSQTVLPQPNVPIQQVVVEDKDKKTMPNLKLVMDSATPTYAQTPTDAKYNAHMQFLQQQLSSITMTNQVPGPLSPQTLISLDFGKAMVDSNMAKVTTGAPAGAPSAAHLASDIPGSPVQEQEAALYPPKVKQLADLNSEIAKINQRRDSAELSLEKVAEVVASRKEIIEQVASSTAGAAKQLEVPAKERKVSRFRISVVKEPDDSKLVVPEKHDVKSVQEPIAEATGAAHEEPANVVKPEVRAAINDTYEMLENIIINSYGVQDPLNPDVTILQHAVGNNAPHIGTTAATTPTPSVVVLDHKSPPQRLIKQNAIDVNSDDDYPHNPDRQSSTDAQCKAGSIDHLEFKLRKIFSNSSTSIQMQILYPKYSKKQIEKSLPDIVVHPPEESMSKSLPDIHAVCRRNRDDGRSYSEHEDSDVEIMFDRSKLRDYKSDTESKTTPDWFTFGKVENPKRSIPAKYRRRRKQAIRTFSLDRGKNRRLSLQNPNPKSPPIQSTLSHHNLQNLCSSDSDCSDTKRMRLFKDFTKPRLLAADTDPSNWLKFKQKQSLSMHNVYSYYSDDSINKYHTIHSPCESGMSSRYARRRSVKKTGSFGEIVEKLSPPMTAATSYSSSYLKTDRILDVEDDDYLVYRFAHVERNSKGTQCDYDRGELTKCCCGNKVCSTVVPIHQYLETHFKRTAEESFEEMLNRQKAELNALMEAHRKQQLAFMRITEQKKSQPKDDEINANN